MGSTQRDDVIDLMRENAALRKSNEEWKALAADLEQERNEHHRKMVALRKRVEELEIGAGSAAMTIRMAQARADKAEARAEKAEREGDKLQADLDLANLKRCTADPPCCERVESLQADLDAALLVIAEASRHSAVRLQDRMCSEGSVTTKPAERCALNCRYEAKLVCRECGRKVCQHHSGTTNNGQTTCSSCRLRQGGR